LSRRGAVERGRDAVRDGRVLSSVRGFGICDASHGVRAHRVCPHTRIRDPHETMTRCRRPLDESRLAESTPHEEMKIDRLAVARARAAQGGGVWRRAGRRPSIVRPNDATYAGASFGRRTRARCIGNTIPRARARPGSRENVPRARRRRNCRLAKIPLEGLFGGVRAPTRVARIPKSRDATRNARESVCARVCQRARR
jgi:hypothetical protein